MRQIKVYVHDTECDNCHRKVNKKTAEIEDWNEIIFVDRGGMSISRIYICQHCIDSWDHEKHEVVSG